MLWGIVIGLGLAILSALVGDQAAEIKERRRKR